MFSLKATILVLILASMFLGLHCLKCLCTGRTCSPQGDIDCGANEVCFAAEFIKAGGNITVDKGCTRNDECDDILFCPDRGGQCLKFGCCNTELCKANYTHTYTPPSPSAPPTPNIQQPMTSSTPPIMASPSVAEKTTQAPDAKPTSSLAAEMTSKLTMPSSESMTQPVEPMSSSKLMQTSTTEALASTQMNKTPDVKPTSVIVKPSQSENVRTSPKLVTPTPIDNRPPCDGAERIFSMGTFVIIAVAVLVSGMF